MPWITRGLARGIVTTGYPRRPDGYDPGFCSSIVVDPDHDADASLAEVAARCPTDAISVVDGRARLDRGRCVLCGRCSALRPDVFRLDPGHETSVIGRSELVVPDIDDDDAGLEVTREQLARRVKALRRSIHIRHVDAGSDGSDEWEVAALTNPIYDVQRLGIYFTASPRHADVLLVTGLGSAGMVQPLRHTYDVMPHPKVVIAAGVDAASGGLVGSGYAARGGIDDLVPVDVYVPGSPPSPFGLLHGILLSVGLLPTKANPGAGSSPERPTGQPFPEGSPPRDAR